VVSSEGVSTDSEKVKVISEWPQPQAIRKIKSFHGLAIFCHRFIKNFSTSVAPITDCLRNDGLQWIPVATKTFKEVKMLTTKALVMRLPDFSNVFEVT